ncbi:MAG: single-stranded DNA-binding protein [Dehalococcoidia bacterium]|nr:single-stranded DNA-binding protein [Dehalococcoidia bacterium]
MASLNKVMIIGNVGSDPEMRFTANGKPVTSFSVATNRVYSSPDGERKEETEWFNVVVWNKLAELCNQFLGKGRLVYVEGRLRTRSWEGQDGQKHYRTELIAEVVTFLDKGGQPLERSDKQTTSERGDPREMTEATDPEDLPF